MRVFEDEALLAKWDEKLESGLFRSSHKTAEFRTLSDHGFHAQFNAAQASAKRGAGQYAKPPPPPPVCSPFNPEKFNFTKANKEEILMRVDVVKGRLIVVDSSSGEDSGHPLFCNVSPLSPGHYLLVPWMERCLPQILTAEALELGIQLMSVSKRSDMRIVFNGMGAWASVNHLHLQGVYLRDLGSGDGIFPIERLPQSPVCQVGSVTLCEVPSAVYPLSTLIVRIASDSCREGWQRMLAQIVGTALKYMQSRDIAHNLSIADGGRTVYLFPRKKNDNLGDGGLNCAAFEVNGQVFCKNQSMFDTITLDKFHSHLQSQVELPVPLFAQVRACLVRGMHMHMHKGSGAGAGQRQEGLLRHLHTQLADLHRENQRLHESR